MIRIILIEDRPAARAGVAAVLEEARDMRLVGSFDDHAAAVRFAALVEPEVAIIDIEIPRTDAPDVARRLRAVSPRTRLVMVCVQAQLATVRQDFWAGANGFVLKEHAGEEAAAAVRAVHAGERYVSSRIASHALEERAEEDPLDRLSARELEVLRLVVEGNTSNQMASMLGLSPKSIDTYRSRLMAKLDIDHLPALVKFAIRRGLTSA